MKMVYYGYPKSYYYIRKSNKFHDNNDRIYIFEKTYSKQLSQSANFSTTKNSMIKYYRF